jgi:hypothetical protein
MLRWIAPVVVVLVLASLVTWWVWPADDDDIPADKRAVFVLSYAGASDRLTGMSGVDADEQLRDWARLGLATELGLETAELVGSLYDTFPVRDEGFADLANQQTGPGRSLFAQGVLHLLVPHDDPHRDRTVGLLLDQYRTDSGADPANVRLHRYLIDRASRTVLVESEAKAATTEFRKRHGYVRMRVDSDEGLSDFLARTRALSTVEMSGDQVWAGGWRWREGDGQRLSREDVAVLQRAYDAGDDTTPAFSLDPGPVETVEDLNAIFPGIGADLIDGLAHDTWDGPRYRSAAQLIEDVQRAVLGDLTEAELSARGLATDRVQLWALWSYLLGQSPYGQARYDGGLNGTEIGMTLFYTDYVTKDWVNGVGTGVPTDAVAGFVPNTDATTPWSHCENGNGSASESGRLWFGQNDAAYARRDDRISIGAQPTRLFTKSDGEAGEEVESSYSFGRGLRWWDQHHQAVADYEPQFQRLDQIMRWSTALDWLGDDADKLPSHTSSDIREGLRFADWYGDHDELRERAPISFVSPPAAKNESVLTVPSDKFEDCGLTAVRGGVSLGDFSTRKARAGQTFATDLSGPLARAGIYEKGSTFDPATGTGSMRRLSIDDEGARSSYLQQTISRPGPDTVRVAIKASPRRVALLGDLKVWRKKTAPRSSTMDLYAADGQVSQQVALQGHDLGGITAVKDGGLITLRWRRGVIDRVRNAMESLQNRLLAGRSDTPVDGFLYGMRDNGGRTLYRVGNEREPWLSITSNTAPGAKLVFRLGAPGPDGAQYSFSSLVAEPVLPPGGWLKVTPKTKGAAAQAVVERAPPNGSVVRVSARDGRTARLYLDGDVARVAVDDPILGRDGLVEGAALLRDYQRVAAAMREAEKAADGMYRGVDLDGDGVALVSAHEVRLAGSTDSWAFEVARATAEGRAPFPRFGIVGDHLFHHADVGLDTVAGTSREAELGDLLDGGYPVLLSDGFRATLPQREGPFVAKALPRDRIVTVAEAEVDNSAVPIVVAAQPAVWVNDRHTWWHVGGRIPVGGSEWPGTGSGGNAGTSGAETPPTSTTASGPSGSARPTPPLRVFLVCNEDEDDGECAA